MIVYKPFSTSLQKSYAAPEGSAWDKQSQEQKDVSMLKLEPHPEEVSNVSSVHQVFHEKGEEDPEPDIDMLAGVKSDIVRSDISTRYLCF